MNIINKDITTINRGIIIQQVNCQGAMGSGVAKGIYEKYPSVRLAYWDFCKYIPKNQRLGRYHQVPINENIIVVNLFSQFTYGRTGKHTNEDILIKLIHEVCAIHKHKTVYAPYKIGCGLGGGDWERILKETSEIPNLVYCKY